jgi:malate dehydrogenase (oxaloacetate-decarboxylating)(NADP+)
LLKKYRSIATCFNDDIQGTASVVLAGMLASNELTGKSKLADHRFLFLGAGEAGTGIADLFALTISRETGVSLEEGRQISFFVDSKGMISSERDNLEDNKKPYAHDLKKLLNFSGESKFDFVISVVFFLFCFASLVPKTFSDAVDIVKPSAIIGVSGQGKSFSQDVVEKMTKLNKNPLIFALSNPTDKSECTAQEAYEWSNGKCVYASGTSFDPVEIEGKEIVPGQANNAYIFPGFGLGAVASRALIIEDEDFIVAASALSGVVPKKNLDIGCCYPDLADIRHVSQTIAAAVAKNIYENGRSEMKDLPKGFDWFDHVGKMMYTPSYERTSLPSKL